MNCNNGYLVHHGIKGQKWGVRRFQNEDGSLTPAGKRAKQIARDAGSIGGSLGLLTVGAASKIGDSSLRIAKIAYMNNNYSAMKRYGGDSYLNRMPKPLIPQGVKATKPITVNVKGLEISKGYDYFKGTSLKARLSTPAAKKAMKVGAIITAFALAAYGAYTLGKHVVNNHKEKKERND